MSEGIAAVVFDFDGALVDSESVWDAARREVAARNGGRYDGDEFTRVEPLLPARSTQCAAGVAGMVVIASPNRRCRPEPDALAQAALVVEYLDELT